MAFNSISILTGSILATAVLFVVFFPSTIFGIKCWTCNSRFDIGCGDPFDNSTYQITDCDSGGQLKTHLPGVRSTMCRKMTQKVNGEWRFIRSCAFLGEPGIGGDERYCVRRANGFNIYVEDCLCIGKDGCNGSNLNKLYEHLLAIGFGIFTMTFLVFS